MRYPKIKTLPSWYPMFDAITVYPIGIFIKSECRDDGRLLRHENVHWVQQTQLGAVRFYSLYLYHWIRCGFSYSANPFEKEAAEWENAISSMRISTWRNYI